MTIDTRLKVFYSDVFDLPLPDGHRFPLAKYRLLREHLQSRPCVGQLAFCLPPSASDGQLRMVHTKEYLAKLREGRLTRVEQRRIGFPWSPELVERSRRSTGATIGAARAALRDGAAIHLAGGTHHAFADHGQGYCVFNDVAVASRVLLAEPSVERIVVIDLDVHQGNGTADIFKADQRVFTFSMHGETNFPFAKCDGDYDIALPDGTGDACYLQRLQEALATHLPLDAADMVFYLAGADPYEHDRLGKLKLTRSGLAARDRMVLEACRQRDVPITVVMAGGYARDTQQIVSINTATVEAVVETISEDGRERAADHKGGMGPGPTAG